MAEVRKITAEDLWKIRRPASASLSPDGSQAVVAVTRRQWPQQIASLNKTWGA